MTTSKELTAISKFLSLVLRHQPQQIGLALDEAGWVAVDDLLHRAQVAGRPISRTQLQQVVAESDKQRFALSSDGQRIRANQGHSVDVELGLAPEVPPERLYHGTATRFLASILADGLRKGQRHHVHLTEDLATAGAVGRRYGALALLEVDAARMHREGGVFMRTANGVWLTEAVPPAYLTLRD